MKEFRQSIIEIPYEADPEKLVGIIENEVKKHWDNGWVFVKAEPDRLLDSVCIFFEREVYIDEVH